MKCIAAVVMVAFVAVAESSLLPLVYGGAAYTLPHTTVVQSNSAPKLAYAAAPYAAGLHYYPYAAGLPYYAYGAPLAYAAPAPTLLLQKEARYLAANRGAIHEALLPGHEISQQQLNLEPAAGTV
ncbi:adult cuticle protein 1-like [Culex pipiens pallens]|uniref:adult cuticle protein 1-like n=1 Tax=Culex pipiens pallens TaxID=42434 RepID=UPI001953AE39|nr:adult cuticle protein 1-like [Culex pipiens pallens]